MYCPPPPVSERAKLGWKWGRIVLFGLIILHAKFPLPTMSRSCLKVPGGGWVGGGVESKLSVQLRPKLKNIVYTIHVSRKLI